MSDVEVNLVNRIRTDLDKFHDIEIQYLMYHGASLVDVCLQKFHEKLYASCEKVPLQKLDFQLDEVKKVLEKSHKFIR